MAMHVAQWGMGWFPEQSGGLNRMFYELVHHLPRVGVDVTARVTGSEDVHTFGGPDVEAFAPMTAPLPTRWWHARKAAREVVADASLDLIATHFALYAWPWRDLIGQRPFVVHFHGPWAQESLVEGHSGLAVRSKAWIEQAVFDRADGFVVLSTAFRDVLHRTYGVPLDRIRIVPGGVRVERFAVEEDRRAVRARLGWPTDRPVVFAVRRLAQRMGLDVLIDAVGRVRESVPDVWVAIAGKGPLREALQAQIDARELGDHVQLLGFVSDDDLPYAYRAADLSVVPTQALEGFGLITIESLAAGTPVLVTPVGALPDVVCDLEPALVLPGTHADDVAAGIAEALRGARPVPTAGACRAFVRERHDWPVIARATRSVYEELL